MKKSVLIACLALGAVCALAAIGFITGNGNIIDEQRVVKGFTGVSASSAAHVVISKGEKYSCVVSLDSNLLPSFETKVERGVLVMGFKPGTSVQRYKKLEIKITMPEIKKVEASGASKVELEKGFTGKELSVNLSGASSFSAAAVYDLLGIKVTGSSKVDLKGKYGDIAIDESGASRIACEGGALGLSGEVSGASTVDFSGCALDDADLAASGASGIRLGNVATKIKANLSGASELKYEGSPKVLKSLSGASTIKRLD
jgi:hypothetical protein